VVSFTTNHKPSVSGHKSLMVLLRWYCCNRDNPGLNPGHSTILLRSEIPSSMCAKLRTVAASNNRDHPTRSLSSSSLASTINCLPGSQALLEVTHQDHSIGITLLLLVRATYISFCSSRTSRSWWIIQSTQHHRRGRNSINFWICYIKMRNFIPLTQLKIITSPDKYFLFLWNNVHEFLRTNYRIPKLWPMGPFT